MTAALRKPENIVMICAVVLLYAVNVLFLRDNTGGGFGWFCRCYLNDLICPLLLLSYADILLLTRDMELRRLHVVLFICAVSGTLWEMRIAELKPQAVTDIGDFLCYLAGGFLYWMICSLISLLRNRTADKQSL